MTYLDGWDAVTLGAVFVAETRRIHSLDSVARALTGFWMVIVVPSSAADSDLVANPSILP